MWAENGLNSVPSEHHYIKGTIVTILVYCLCFCVQDWTWYGGICHWSRWMIQLDAPLQHYRARGVLESRETAGLAAQHQTHSGSAWCMVTLTHSQNADTCSQQRGATARGWSQQKQRVSSVHKAERAAER